MLYESLSNYATDGLTYGEYAFALLASLYALYILMWVASWLHTKAYAWIQDYEHTTENLMCKFLSKLYPLLGKEKSNLPDGWYRFEDLYTISSTDKYKYDKYINGYCVQGCEKREVFDKPPSDFIKVDDDYKYFIGYRLSFLRLGLPAIICATILLIDTQPLVALIGGVCYAVMYTARAIVRMTKKFNKHLEDHESGDTKES